MELSRRRVAQVEVAVWSAGDAPVVYLHGVPNGGEMWEPFLERTGGIAPDLPGFGASDKPVEFDYSIAGYARWLAELTAGLDRFSLVMHDWGGVGLALAQERPEAIDRLVLIDAVPLLPGYRWHRIARVWRRPVVGELFMGFATKRGFKLLGRRQGALPRAVVDEQVEQVWRHFDQGTMRAILKLYRSAPEDELARAGERLGAIGAPALVVWGERDPYIPTRFAHDYAAALGGETALFDAGHWPWLEDAGIVDRVASFLAA